MIDKKDIGKRGEDLAAAFLESKGYQVLVRNYRHGRSEIDLVMKKDQLLVFVEVKARRSKAYGEPESFVNRAKAARVIAAAEHFIFENDWQHNIRFDVVAVSLGKENEIEHFEDAFY